MTPLLAALIIVIWCALCACQDARKGRISHWLNYPALAAAALYIAVSGTSLLGAGTADIAVATVTALTLTLPGYSRKRMGAGDVKMLLVLAIAGGTLFVLAVVALAAVGLALWSVAGPAIWNRLPQLIRPGLLALAPTRVKPAYAPFLCAAVIIALAILPHPPPPLFSG